MKIISKFHDYYDTAIGYGIDPNIIYNRKTTEYSLESEVGKIVTYCLNYGKNSFERLIISPVKDWYDYNNVSVIDTVIVIFCGNIYIGLEFIKRFNDPTVSSDKEICYSVEQVEKFFTRHNEKLQKKIKNKYSWREKYNIDRTNLTKYWKEFNQKQTNSIIDMHFEVDSPIIAILNNGTNFIKDPIISVNPCLKNIQFYKCVDTFTTFQELSMFIGGVMGGKVPAMVGIKDEDRIAMHGFDKWSFRKMPEK